jgi:hypothetical protein
MAARFWRLQLALELAVAAVITWGISSWLGLRTTAAFAVVPAVFLLLQLLLVAVSIFLGRVLTRSALAAFPWRVLFSESPAFLVEKLAMSVEPWLRWSENPPAPGAGDQRPVLLIHGVLCNRAIWRGLQRKLHTAGYSPVRALNLAPLFADLDEYARQVAKELSSMRAEARGARVAIIGHSMGGLVARAAAVRDVAEAVSCIVTLGTPHHGSVLARFVPGAAARQMLPGSAWLKQLNVIPRSESVPITTIYSMDDNHVAPATSAELAGATPRAVAGLGHFGLLHSARVLHYLLAALSQQDPGKRVGGV